MNRDEVVAYWMESAADDLVVVEHLLQSGDYLWCLFVAHLVVEKALKAAVVSYSEDHAPPIHNLNRLARLAGL
jgi:HEPN domain-containing protein